MLLLCEGPYNSNLGFNNTSAVPDLITSIPARSDMQAASLKMNILSRGWTDLQGSDSFKSYVIYITV